MEGQPNERPIEAQEPTNQPITELPHPDDLVRQGGRVVRREVLERPREFGSLMGHMMVREFHEE